MMKKIINLTEITMLAMILCFLPVTFTEAAVKNLDKIGAAANLQKDWILIDTDMSDEEIMELINVEQATINSVRQQWASISTSTATIEYDIVQMELGADIIINTVPATDTTYKEVNDMPDDLKDKLVENVQKGLKAQGAVISSVEKLTVGGSYSWKIVAEINGIQVCEYQTLHEGKYITVSINSVNTELDTEKMNFLTNFMNQITFVGANDAKSDMKNQPENSDKSVFGDTSGTISVTNLLCLMAIGFVVLAFVAGIIVLIVVLVHGKNKKKQQ